MKKESGLIGTRTTPTTLIVCLCIIALSTLPLIGAAQKESAAAKELKKIWISNESVGSKAEAVKKLNLRVTTIPLPEGYALTLLVFQAEQNKDAQMRAMIKHLETLSPGMKKELDTQYPGIIAQYEGFALSKQLNLFQFSAELSTPITLKEIEAGIEKGGTEPSNYMARMRFYTISMHRELYDSKNIVILPTWKKIMSLWNSLTQEQKELLDKSGYPYFWKEQNSLYNHKFSNKDWACTCGTETASFPNLTDCGVKRLPVTTEKNLDKSTLLLNSLTQGNLEVVEVALQDPTVATYSGCKDNIVQQLVFLHLATLNSRMINPSMKIGLVQLWNKGHINGSNSYFERIGLNEQIIVDLENYYRCILKIESVTAIQQKSAVVEKDAASIPVPVVKETLKPQPAKSVSGRTITVQKFERIHPQMHITELRDAWDGAVQNEIANRQNLFLCAETRVVNDSTIELDLRGCGNGTGTFK